MTPLEHLEGVLLPILRTSPRVAILASGGMGSTMLLASALEICRRHGMENSWLVLTIPMANNSWEHAGRVCEWASQRWNTLLPMAKIGEPIMDQEQALADACSTADQMDLSDVYLLGSTALPTDIEIPNAPLARSCMKEPAKLIRPWIDHAKDHVVRLMCELNLREVMEMSHTCSVTRNLRCGNCRSCRERTQAFSKVGVVDMGKM